MSIQTINILINSIVTIPIFIIGVYLYFKDKDIRNNCTVKTKGIIIRYAHYSPSVPIVKYEVEGIEYTGRLRYTYSITKSSPFKKNEIIDYTASVLRINTNSIVGITSLREYFPINSEIDVYYNPDNPKRNYVLRYCKNLIPVILTLTSLTIFIVGNTILYLVL